MPAGIWPEACSPGPLMQQVGQISPVELLLSCHARTDRLPPVAALHLHVGWWPAAGLAEQQAAYAPVPRSACLRPATCW